MLTFDDYCSQLLQQLHVPAPPNLRPEVTLEEELGIDSLQTLEILVVSEELAGLKNPSARVPAILTIGDAYGYYRSLATVR